MSECASTKTSTAPRTHIEDFIALDVGHLTTSLGNLALSRLFLAQTRHVLDDDVVRRGIDVGEDAHIGI